MLEEFMNKLLKEQGTDLFRYKGVIAIKGVKHKWVFQVGGGGSSSSSSSSSSGSSSSSDSSSRAYLAG